MRQFIQLNQTIKKMINKKYFLLAGLWMVAPWAQAQRLPTPIRPHPPIYPPITARLVPTQLGTSEESSKLWQRDLEDLVKKTMPPYQDRVLVFHFKAMKQKYLNGGPEAHFTAPMLKSLFQMEIKEGEGHTKKASYSFYPKLGRVLITKDLFTGNFLSQEQAKDVRRHVQDQHRELLNRIDVGSDQVFAMNLHFRYIDLAKNTGQVRVESEGPPQVEGFMTYVARAVDGILVDGSYLKIFSHDDSALAGLSADWPRFVLHPALTSFELRTKDELQKEIAARAQKSLNPKHEYNAKMAVVLRPALYNKQKVFIPSLKVGIYSKPPGRNELSELNGEAGLKFYVNLMKQPLSEESNNGIERNQ